MEPLGKADCREAVIEDDRSRLRLAWLNSMPTRVTGWPRPRYLAA